MATQKKNWNHVWRFATGDYAHPRVITGGWKSGGEASTNNPLKLCLRGKLSTRGFKAVLLLLHVMDGSAHSGESQFVVSHSIIDGFIKRIAGGQQWWAPKGKNLNK